MDQVGPTPASGGVCVSLGNTPEAASEGERRNLPWDLAVKLDMLTDRHVRVLGWRPEVVFSLDFFLTLLSG